ncbi:MAG: tripartite tricarboxylate transporter substrate binding protein [Pseudorhodoferax sp.]
MVATLAGLCLLPATAQQPWPTRPVRWVVPFAAGGTADATARHIAQKLSERWGQAVMVDNKPGAHTAIAAADVARAAPDGYTLFQPINSTLTVNPHAFGKLPYNPRRDFTPIAVIASVPLIFVANDTLPAKSMPELIALARKNPDSVTMGGGVVGVQLAAERFLRDAGIQARYVPYKSGADVTKGLLSGEIQSGLDGVPAYPPLFKSGKLRPLATNSPHRIASLPDVPTLAELGLKNSNSPMWHGLMGPAGLPPEIQRKISADLKEVLAMPDLRERMEGLGLEPAWSSAEDFVKLVGTESATLAPLIKDLNIKLD